jgi:hypothetical protein
MRLRTRSSVDFPHPDGPMNAVTLRVEGNGDLLQGSVVAIVEVDPPHGDLLLEFSGGIGMSRYAGHWNCDAAAGDFVHLVTLFVLT